MFPPAILQLITHYEPSLFYLQDKREMWIQFLHNFQYGRTSRGTDILMRNSMLVPITSLDAREMEAEDSDGGIIALSDMKETGNELLTIRGCDKLLNAPTSLIYNNVEERKEYIRHIFILFPYAGLECIISAIKEYAFQYAIEVTGTETITKGVFFRLLTDIDIEEWELPLNEEGRYYLYTLWKEDTMYNAIYRQCDKGKKIDVLHDKLFYIINISNIPSGLYQYLFNVVTCWLLDIGDMKTLWTSHLTKYVPYLFTEMYEVICQNPRITSFHVISHTEFTYSS